MASPNFVYDWRLLSGSKVDLIPLGSRDARNFLTADGDYIPLLQSLDDLRTAVINGILHGFTRQNHTPVVPSASADYLVVTGSTGDLYFSKGGVMIPLTSGSSVSGSGGGGPLSASYTQGVFQSDQTILLSSTYGGMIRIEDRRPIGTSQIPGLAVLNSASATNGNQKYSPIFEQAGMGFASTPSRSSAVRYGWQVRPVQGTNDPSGELVLWNATGSDSFYESLKIVGIPATQYSITLDPTSGNTSLSYFPGGGYALLSTAVTQLRLQAAGTVFIQGADLLPLTDLGQDTGASTFRWRNVFSTTYDAGANTSASFNFSSGRKITLSDLGGNLGSITLGVLDSADSILGGNNVLSFRPAGRANFQISSTSEIDFMDNGNPLVYFYGGSAPALFSPFNNLGAQLGDPTRLWQKVWTAVVSGSTSAYLSLDDTVGSVLHYGETGPRVIVDSSYVTSIGAVSVILSSSAADGASAVAAIVDTKNTWSTGGARLLSLRTHGTEKLGFELTNGGIDFDLLHESGGILRFGSAGGGLFGNTTNKIEVSYNSPGEFNICIGGAFRLAANTGSWYPNTDVGYSLGDSGHRYLTGFFGNDTVGASPTGSLFLRNNTAATNGQQQHSPFIEFSGKGFASTPSRSDTVKFAISARPVQSTDGPEADLVIYHATGSDPYAERFAIGRTIKASVITSTELTLIGSSFGGSAGAIGFSAHEQSNGSNPGTITFWNSIASARGDSYPIAAMDDQSFRPPYDLAAISLGASDKWWSKGHIFSLTTAQITGSGGTYGLNITAANAVSTVNIDQGNATNVYALTLSNLGPGTTGLMMQANNAGSYSIETTGNIWNFQVTNNATHFNILNEAYSSVDYGYFYEASSLTSTKAFMRWKTYGSAATPQLGPIWDVQDSTGKTLVEMNITGSILTSGSLVSKSGWIGVNDITKSNFSGFLFDTTPGLFVRIYLAGSGLPNFNFTQATFEPLHDTSTNGLANKRWTTTYTSAISAGTAALTASVELAPASYRVGFQIDTTSDWNTVNRSRLLSIKTNGTEKMVVDSSGALWFRDTSYGGAYFPHQTGLYASGSSLTVGGTGGRGFLIYDSGDFVGVAWQAGIGPYLDIGYKLGNASTRWLSMYAQTVSAGTAALTASCEAVSSATSVGLVVDTTTKWSESGARLASFRNLGVEKVYVNTTGSVIPAGDAGTTGSTLGSTTHRWESTYSRRFSGMSGSVPTLSFGRAAGQTATLSMGSNSNDTCGVINVTAGTAASTSGAIVTASFSAAYDTPPFVIVKPANAAAISLETQGSTSGKAYVKQSDTTTTSFVISWSTASAVLLSGTLYQYMYHVLQ